MTRKQKLERMRTLRRMVRDRQPPSDDPVLPLEDLEVPPVDLDINDEDPLPVKKS